MGARVTSILVRLALAYLAGRLSPNPASFIAFVAELGRVIRPEDVATLWRFAIEAAEQLRSHQLAHPEHTDEEAAQWWLDSEGVEHPVNAMDFGDPANPGGGPTGGMG
jgi:hypothetical protein